MGLGRVGGRVEAESGKRPRLREEEFKDGTGQERYAEGRMS